MPSIIANQCLVTTAEATWGTSGAFPAVHKFHGVEEFTVEHNERVEAMPAVGWYGPGTVADRQSADASFTMSGTFCYQEQNKFLNGVFNALEDPTTSSGQLYFWQYFAPVASTPTNYTYGLEFGTSNMPYRMPGCVFNGLKVSGEAGGLWKFEIPGFAKCVQNSTVLSTNGLVDARTMTPVAMKDTHLRLTTGTFTTGPDPSSAGQLDATLISFELNIDPKRHSKLFAGSAAAGGWGDGRYEGTLKTVLEFTTGTSGVMEWINSMLDLTSAGAASTGNALQKMLQIYATHANATGVSSGLQTFFTFAGIVAEPVKLWDDRDGNMTVELNWTGKFSTGMTNTTGSTGTGNWLVWTAVTQSSKTT